MPAYLADIFLAKKQTFKKTFEGSETKTLPQILCRSIVYSQSFFSVNMKMNPSILSN